MAEDIFKPAGATKARKPDAGGGVVRQVPVFGIVKNNVDPIRSGRLQVYISDLGGDDPDNPDNWATVSYMPPYYGFVEPTAGDTGEGDFVANPASYGMWYSPPDLETTVICIFINGDPNYGFYIGAAPKPEALHMVPAIGASENVITNNGNEAQSYGGASILPVTNINTNNEKSSESSEFLDLPKPIHSFQASILFKQGLIRDPIRGPITSSANRESPSRVGWGVSSPGKPIYAGGYTDASIAQASQSDKGDQQLKIISRQGGHNIVLDDGDLIGRNNLLRLRSGAGHQILMSDDGQTIFIIHSNGQSWVELGKEGTIDMFCTNSFNVRTQGDINFHADNDINLHAKKKLNIKAEDITIFSEKSTVQRVGTDCKIETVGKYNLKVGGVMSLASNDVASFLSSSTTYINGNKINLNTGQGPAPDAVPPLTDKPTTDTLFDTVKGYTAAPGKLKTIVTRAPAHTPWTHANQGVNVSASPNADDNLPAAPSGAAAQALGAASASPAGTPVTPAGLATVPPTAPVSNSIDATTAGSMVGAVATNAASGPAAAAVAAGSGIVQTASGAVASLGALAQSPIQLDTGGILKPGSSALVNALVKGGNPLDSAAAASALPKNLFTGQAGIDSVKSLVSSSAAQMNSMVKNFQQSQTLLTTAGLLTGKEAATSMAGLVMSGTTAGVSSTLSTISSTLAGGKALLTAGKAGVSSPIINAISSGKFASNLAEATTGGMGAILGAVTSMGAVAGLAKGNNRGAVALAVSAVAGSIPTLPNRKAINLRTLVAENNAVSEARAAGTNPFSAPTDLLKLAGRIGGPQVSKVTNAVTGGLNSVNKLLNASTPAQQLGGITSVIGSIGSIGAATGNKNLAKSARQINSVIGATNQVTKGLSSITNASSAIGALGGVGQISGALGRLGGALGNKNLAKSTQKISSAVRNTQNILKSVDKLVTSKNINTTLGAFGSIVNNASRIKGMFSNSSKASGMSNIPAGNLSVSSIVNKSLGKLGIPKNPALNSIITNAVTSAVNNIAFPKSLQSASALGAGLASKGMGALSNIQNDINSSLSSLQAAGKNLTSLSMDKLGPGAAAELNAAIGSIGFGGAGALKLPVIGENTFNDASVMSQIGSLLDDPRIPAPSYSDEPDPAGIAALEEAIAENDAIDAEFTSYEQLLINVESAREYYFAVEESLPQGDPEIETARAEYIQLAIEAQDLIDKIEGRINY